MSNHHQSQEMKVPGMVGNIHVVKREKGGLLNQNLILNTLAHCKIPFGGSREHATAGIVSTYPGQRVLY